MASGDLSCIFCKIIAGQIPCYRVYEDDAVLAFLDIGPLTPGHTLVIPKTHHATLMDLPPEVAAAIAERLPKLSRAILKATGTAACHLLLNSGAEAMQTVHHVHFHIIPRRDGDNFRIPWPHGKLDADAAATLGQAIIAAL